MTNVFGFICPEYGIEPSLFYSGFTCESHLDPDIFVGLVSCKDMLGPLSTITTQSSLSQAQSLNQASIRSHTKSSLVQDKNPIETEKKRQHTLDASNDDNNRNQPARAEQQRNNHKQDYFFHSRRAIRTWNQNREFMNALTKDNDDDMGHCDTNENAATNGQSSEPSDDNSNIKADHNPCITQNGRESAESNKNADDTELCRKEEEEEEEEQPLVPTRFVSSLKNKDDKHVNHGDGHASDNVLTHERQQQKPLVRVPTLNLAELSRRANLHVKLALDKDINNTKSN
jgi:hypothetical protein